MLKFASFLPLTALVLGGCPGSEEGGPVRIVSFAASPAEVEEGGEVTLTYETSGARTVEIYAYPMLADGTEGTPTVLVPESSRVDGSTSDILFRSTRYVLTAHGQNTRTEEVVVTVTTGGTPAVVVGGFFVQPTEVEPDEPATLFWVTGNADYVTIQSRPRRVPQVDWEPTPGDVESSGQMDITALETTEYRLTATGASGESVYKETLLEVFGLRPQRPQILSFTATPEEIDQGDASLLEWTTQDAATVSGIVGVSAATVNGSKDVTPSRTTRYTLTAARDGFLDLASVTVVVNAVAGAPAVEAFVAAPPLLGDGGTTRLTWDTTNVVSVDIEPGVVAGGAPDGGIDVTPADSTDYILTATGPLGEAQANLHVTVVPIGGLVISEIMDDPAGVGESFGSWIEIYNATGEDLFLSGLEIADGLGSHEVAGDAAVASGGYVVLGGEDDIALNGGAAVDYEWTGITLDDDDVVSIAGGSVVVDSVDYDASWPSSAGTSMETLVPDDAGANDAAGGWCAASTGYGGDGNSGTPGAPNDCP